MGFLSSLFGGKTAPRAVEWSGDTIEVKLDPINTQQWPSLIGDGKTIRNRWANLRLVPNRNGAAKLLASIDGTEVGEVPAARLKQGSRLSEALNQGVNVGVVALRHRVGEIEGSLFVGSGYKYRPKPPWAE